MDKDETQKIILRAVKNLSPVVITGLQALGLISPEYLIIGSSIQAIAAYYGDYADERAKDFFKPFEDHKELIVKEVVQSEKFKAVLLKTFSNHMTESNEDKRIYLKNYIRLWNYHLDVS